MNTIRLATENDAVAIDRDLYPHLRDEYASQIQWINRVLHSSDYVLVVADAGSPGSSLLVGAATLHMIVQASAGPKGYIDDLIVVPKCRQQGVARLLFEFLEDGARRLGIRKIFFTSAPWRNAANEFHVAVGYHLRGKAVADGGTNYYEKTFF